ncbi:host attachment protein [Novosphingobium sp. M1R2S20]|uniref:Host attachment protein n=1 Tax=Novosphingobium rhizovicinum TaxID=3228928 RepID=A0ABV3R6V5_9SPHN
MLLPHGTVFALVDGRNFELYRNSGTEAEPQLDPLPVPELEVTNFSAGMRRNDVNLPHTSRTGDGSNDSFDESAHAIAAADWLNHQVLQHKIEKLVIIADPRSLGEMRKRYHKQLEGVLLKELAKTMAGRPTAEIVSALKG